MPNSHREASLLVRGTIATLCRTPPPGDTVEYRDGCRAWGDRGCPGIFGLATVTEEAHNNEPLPRAPLLLLFQVGAAMPRDIGDSRTLRFFMKF